MERYFVTEIFQEVRLHSGFLTIILTIYDHSRITMCLKCLEHETNGVKVIKINTDAFFLKVIHKAIELVKNDYKNLGKTNMKVKTLGFRVSIDACQ